jgi:hypothetical protein
MPRQIARINTASRGMMASVALSSNGAPLHSANAQLALESGVLGVSRSVPYLVGRRRSDRPRSEPDWGNPAVRDRRGAWGNVSHGRTRIPARQRKRGAGHSRPTGRARPRSIPTPGRWLAVLRLQSQPELSRHKQSRTENALDHARQMYAIMHRTSHAEGRALWAGGQRVPGSRIDCFALRRAQAPKDPAPRSILSGQTTDAESRFA